MLNITTINQSAPLKRNTIGALRWNTDSTILVFAMVVVPIAVVLPTETPIRIGPRTATDTTTITNTRILDNTNST